MTKRELRNMMPRSRALIFIFTDILSVIVAYFFALLVRFDLVYSHIPSQYLLAFRHAMPYWCIITIFVLFCFRLYHSIWTYVSIAELYRMIQAYLVLIPVYFGLDMLLHLHMPRSWYILGYIFAFLAQFGIRVSYRLARLLYIRHESNGTQPSTGDRVMIVGAGSAGSMLLREFNNSTQLNSKVVCLIDDNLEKVGRLLNGVPVVGTRYDIVEMVKKYQVNRIVIAIPRANTQEKKAILDICKKTGCRLQIVPGLYQLINGDVRVQKLRDVEISDLLGREQVNINNEEVLKFISGKNVLVTGGGGSIGSELCRQIAAHSPNQLIIFDIYENNAYDIQQELRRKYPNLNLVTLIGSVRNTHRLNTIMEKYQPEYVFHAAAHKHVPLMEDSPNEAVKNNVMGTYKTAKAAAEHGVKKFILISTDKAVNPTNVMGATKRICEMIVQMMDRKYANTDFAAVRFGNVLGSNGSVIPLFKKQIAEGGPVTVTDKNIIRYFMTIPEAVSLVLQAANYAHGGEIFVLDMGEPVKIDDMARNLIRLSGYKPDIDIKIEYTGLRPGEKMYEELLMDEEGLTDTENKLIHIGHPIQMDDEWFEQQIHKLDEASKNDSADIRQVVADVVDTYKYNKGK